MILSVPTSLVLLNTNVEEIVTKFNNQVYTSSYPVGQQYTYLDNVYENTGETVVVAQYSAADVDTYVTGQILFKDGYVQKVIEGEQPKQPSQYTPLATGYDYSTWATARYAKVQDVPAAFIDANVWDGGFGIKDICFRPDGSYAYVLESFGTFDTIYEMQVVDKDDISTWIKTGNGYSNGNNKIGDSISWNGNGTKFYIMNKDANRIEQRDITVAWDMSELSTTPTDTYTFSTIGQYGLAIKNNNTRLYTYDESTNTIRQFNMTGGNVSTLTLQAGSLPVPDYEGYANYKNGGLDVSDDGAYVYYLSPEENQQAVHMYELGTAFELASEDVKSTKPLLSRVTDTGRMMPDGSSYIIGGNGTMYQYYTATAYDTQYCIHSWADHAVYEKLADGNMIDIRLYTNPSTGDVTFYSSYYSLSAEGWKDTYIMGNNATPGYLYAQLTTDSQDIDGVIYTDGIYTTFRPTTVVFNSNGIFYRTHFAVAAETNPAGFDTEIVVSPIGIDGFTLIGANNPTRPFDIYSYTIATATGEMYYEIEGTQKFDTVALGHVKADRVTIKFINSQGNLVTTVDADINSSRDSLGNLPDWYTTAVYYSESVMEPGSTVQITLTGAEIELGNLLLGISADAGFSNLAMTHKYRDASVFEYDPFNNPLYTERAKISVYSGTVDVDIVDYDMIDRLMTSLGKNLVIMNGSDSVDNSPPDGQKVFSSTMRIGRIMGFDQRTQIENDEIDQTATYAFTLEGLA